MQALISWIMVHQAVVAGLVVGILDFVFAVAPNLQANGILHQIYLWVKSIGSSAPPAAPSA